MKKSCRRLSPVRVSATLLLTATLLYAAGTAVRYEAEPNASKMRIDGTSTIHDWSVEGTLIGGHFEADQAFFKDPAAAQGKPVVEVTIPVRSLKSGKRPMDNVMYEAMNQKEHPAIKYRLSGMKLQSPAAKPEGPFVFDTVGEVTVSGVTRTNNMVVVMEKLAGNKLKFSGTNAMKMTDFGIKPPAPAIALGAIKTGDDVKVSFEWVTAQSAGATGN